MAPSFSCGAIGAAVDKAVASTVPDDTEQVVDMDFSKPTELKRLVAHSLIELNGGFAVGAVCGRRRITSTCMC